jgi:hypothetical protein
MYMKKIHMKKIHMKLSSDMLWRWYFWERNIIALAKNTSSLTRLFNHQSQSIQLNNCDCKPREQSKHQLSIVLLQINNSSRSDLAYNSYRAPAWETSAHYSLQTGACATFFVAQFCSLHCMWSQLNKSSSSNTIKQRGGSVAYTACDHCLTRAAAVVQLSSVVVGLNLWLTSAAGRRAQLGSQIYSPAAKVKENNLPGSLPAFASSSITWFLYQRSDGARLIAYHY